MCRRNAGRRLRDRSVGLVNEEVSQGGFGAPSCLLPLRRGHRLRSSTRQRKVTPDRIVAWRLARVASIRSAAQFTVATKREYDDGLPSSRPSDEEAAKPTRPMHGAAVLAASVPMAASVARELHRTCKGLESPPASRR